MNLRYVGGNAAKLQSDVNANFQSLPVCASKWRFLAGRCPWSEFSPFFTLLLVRC